VTPATEFAHPINSEFESDIGHVSLADAVVH
jgi:hypothetical protein